jgi:hypothetical protein
MLSTQAPTQCCKPSVHSNRRQPVIWETMIVGGPSRTNISGDLPARALEAMTQPPSGLPSAACLTSKAEAVHKARLFINVKKVIYMMKVCKEMKEMKLMKQMRIGLSICPDVNENTHLSIFIMLINICNFNTLMNSHDIKEDNESI